MVQSGLGTQHRPPQGGGGRVADRTAAERSTRDGSHLRSPHHRCRATLHGRGRSTVPPWPRSSTTPGSPRVAATASRGGSRWSRIRGLRRQLAALMQPVWDEYVAAAATGQTPFNTVAFEPPGVIAAGQPNELLDRIEQIPVVLVVAADLEKIALMDGKLDRPPITGGALRLPVLLERLLAARGRGLGGVMTTFLSRVEPAAAPFLGLPPRSRLGGDDLPRSAGAPADALAQGAGLVVRHRRPLRRRRVQHLTLVEEVCAPPVV